MGALFLLSRKPVCRLRKVLFWWTERLVTSIFLLPFQKLFLNSSKKWTILGMLHTLYFANENVWNHNYYLIRNSQIWAFLREYELGSLKIKESNSPAFLGWDLDLPQSIPKQLSRNRHHLIQPRTDKVMEKKKYRRDCRVTRESKGKEFHTTSPTACFQFLTPLWRSAEQAVPWLCMQRHKGQVQRGKTGCWDCQAPPCYHFLLLQALLEPETSHHLATVAHISSPAKRSSQSSARWAADI